MSNDRYISQGDVIEFVSASAVTAGAIVLFSGVTDFAGIAVADTPANQVASVSVSGMYRLPKATNVAYATPGVVLYWAAASQQVTTTATGNTRIGRVAAAAATTDTTVAVVLNR